MDTIFVSLVFFILFIFLAIGAVLVYNVCMELSFK